MKILLDLFRVHLPFLEKYQMVAIFHAINAKITIYYVEKLGECFRSPFTDLRAAFVMRSLRNGRINTIKASWVLWKTYKASHLS